MRQFLGNASRSSASSRNFYWDCQGTPGNPLRSTRVLAAAGKGQLREAAATHTPSQKKEAKSLCSIQVTRERVAGSSLRPAVSEALTPAAPRERPAAPLLSGLWSEDSHNGSWWDGQPALANKRPAGWKAALQRTPWKSWWRTSWPRPSNGPLQQRPLASWAATGRALPAGRWRWSSPSARHQWDTPGVLGPVFSSPIQERLGYTRLSLVKVHEGD